MILSNEIALHKSYLNRLLIEIVDHPLLSHCLAFKGGTCATMLGYLDRFSVDLDFDLIQHIDDSRIRNEFKIIFESLGLEIVKEFTKVLLYTVRYSHAQNTRNSLKISVNSLKVKANTYKVCYYPEIDRLVNSQTIETMFANKLVAVMDRYDLHKTIAGRDLYDIHSFFIHGYSYLGPVITERTGDTPEVYIKKLIEFIKQHVDQTIVNEDLNLLLTPQQFQSIRKVLIPESISLLTREILNPQV